MEWWFASSAMEWWFAFQFEIAVAIWCLAYAICYYFLKFLFNVIMMMIILLKIILFLAESFSYLASTLVSSLWFAMEPVIEGHSHTSRSSWDKICDCIMNGNMKHIKLDVHLKELRNFGQT
ncbi:unnamed protein product [Vicia faba]|uniref:Uncharacterized protein n=1 Tax=Vicia faba TaxID=3906 RepID=A0AAV1BAS4_VICFA|nr:unnamed protein product [Vicia faba]